LENFEIVGLVEVAEKIGFENFAVVVEEEFGLAGIVMVVH